MLYNTEINFAVLIYIFYPHSFCQLEEKFSNTASREK